MLANHMLPPGILPFFVYRAQERNNVILSCVARAIPWHLDICWQASYSLPLQTLKPTLDLEALIGSTFGGVEP
jgi:hypothetical protein